MPTTGTMKYLTIGDSTYEVYNTDTEVIQTYAAASGYTNWRPLVVGYSSNSSETTAPTTTTGTTYTFNTIKVKPSDGIIRFGAAALYNGDYTTTISADTLTAARTLTAPDKSGTIALTSDIPSLTGYATTTYVDDAIAALPEPMLFKGSVGTGGTITSLPTAATANEGFTYKVITALSTPVTAKVGDTVISTGSEWVVIPSGDEPSGTVTSVGLSNATNGGLSISGSPITSSGSITVGHTNVLTSAQTTQAVYPIKIDKNGHISGYGSAVSIPTKVSDLTNDSGFITSYTDEKLKVAEVSSNTTYYPIMGTGTTAATRQYDTAGLSYISSDGVKTLSIGASTSNNNVGALDIYSLTSSRVRLVANTSLSSNALVYLPSSNGTIALTSDIPTIPSNNVTGSGSTDYLAKWSGTNTLSSTSLSISTSYNSSSDSYGTIKLYVGSTGQIDWKGQLVLHDGSSSKTITITPPSLTASRTITLPDKTGTIALTSDLPTVPTNVSAFTNDAGYLTSYTETDPTVPSWAKAASKPTYTASEVGALASDTTYVSTITTTAGTHSAISSQSGAVSFNVPTHTSHLTNDSGFITSYTDEKVKSTPATTSTTYYLIGSTDSSENTATTSKHASLVAYTSSNSGTGGYTELRLGNATATSSAGGKAGTIRLYGTNATYYTTLKAGAVASSNKTITFPNASGTVALTDDIPSNTELLNLFYPVGSYYETSDTTFDPNTSWGGTWVLETEGQVHISGSTSGTYQVNGAPTDTNDGGVATVTLTTDEIPAHTHGSKSLTGTATAYSDCGLVSGSGVATGIFSKQATSALANYRLKWEGSSAGSSELKVDASHEHDSVGLGQAHNNMMPYIIVNRWHRTA